MICCGKGVNLAPFTKVRDSGINKALLPIGNKPMIEYVLEWCDLAPFGKITVVSNSDSTPEIAQFIETYKTKRNKQIKSPINVLKFDGETTGEILDQFVDKVAGEYILLPCDFVTDLPPQVLIEEYRNRDDKDIAMSVHYHNKYESIDKKNLTHYYTVYSEDQHLLDIYSKDSVEATKFLELRTQMVWKYPQTFVSTKLLDSFIYMFSADAMDVLKADLSDYSTKSITKIVRDLARRSWKHKDSKDTISFFVLPNQANFIRADNIPAYLEANRHIMKLKAKESQSTAPQSKEKGAATVGADSVVGENTTLGERTSVKKTVVGNNCVIGQRCRLTGSVILDGVTLEDDVVLENCIIGQKAVVHTKARLTNCNIEGGYVVTKSSQIKGETLTILFIEGQEVLSSDESDDDTGSDYSYDEDLDDEFEDDGLFGH